MRTHMKIEMGSIGHLDLGDLRAFIFMLVALQLLQIVAEFTQSLLAIADGTAWCQCFDQSDEQALQFDAIVFGQDENAFDCAHCLCFAVVSVVCVFEKGVNFAHASFAQHFCLSLKQAHSRFGPAHSAIIFRTHILLCDLEKFLEWWLFVGFFGWRCIEIVQVEPQQQLFFKFCLHLHLFFSCLVWVWGRFLASSIAVDHLQHIFCSNFIDIGQRQGS